MRLLQLATGPGELIDLHPHVTVVTGLDPAGRQLLADAVMGLAAGRAVRAAGLLEAHGVLFDLGPTVLALLDIDAGDVQPVVTAADLPALHHTPPTAERTAAEAALAEIEERWDAAGERDAVAQSAVVAATAAVERARLAAERVDEPAAAGPSREELTVQHAEASDQVRRLSEELAGIDAGARGGDGGADRGRGRHRRGAGGPPGGGRATAPMSPLASTRRGSACDPDAGAAAAGRRRLSWTATEAAVEAEREAEERAAGSPSWRAAGRSPRSGSKPRSRRWSGSSPSSDPRTSTRVADELEPVRALDDVAPLPEALDLADELAVLEDDLRTRRGAGCRTDGRPCGGAGAPRRRPRGAGRSRAGRAQPGARPRPRGSARGRARRSARRHGEGGRPVRGRPRPTPGRRRAARRRTPSSTSSGCPRTRST